MGILGFYPSWMRWHWADAPDGEDCFKKVVWAGKWTTMWAAYYSLINTNSEMRLGNLVAANWGIYASTFVRTMLPFAAMGPLYASVTCLSASFRGKVDVKNHVFGAVSTGSLWYVATKKWPNAFFAAFWMSVAAAILQTRRLEGDQFEFFPNDFMLTSLPQHSWHARTPLMDLSVSRDYRPIQSRYHFPAVAEQVSTYVSKPWIVKAYPATEVRVEYNGVCG